VFFFEAYEATFFGAHRFFEGDVVWTWKSDFGERDIVPQGVPNLIITNL